MSTWSKSQAEVQQLLQMLLLKSTLRGHMNELKEEKSMASLFPICICFCSKPFALQSPWIPDRTGLINNIFMTGDQNYP